MIGIPSSLAFYSLKMLIPHHCWSTSSSLMWQTRSLFLLCSQWPLHFIPVCKMLHTSCDHKVHPAKICSSWVVSSSGIFTSSSSLKIPPDGLPLQNNQQKLSRSHHRSLDLIQRFYICLKHFSPHHNQMHDRSSLHWKARYSQCQAHRSASAV